MPTALTGSRGLQESGSGLWVGYQGDALAGLGLPSLVGLIQADQKAVATGFASTALYTTTQSGTYLIASGLTRYANGAANGSITPLVLFTSDDSAATKVVNGASAVSTTSQPAFTAGVAVIQASSGTTIYGSTLFAAAGTPSYTLQMACFRLS